MHRLLSFAAIAFLSTSAPAGVWSEQGDAGELTPQATSGAGSLDSISGATSAGDYVDMFRIYISDPGSFSATTVGGASWDTQLFLFDPDGRGVAHNDDSPSGGLQSRLTSALVTVAGEYWLAVSGYNRDPSSAMGLIWANTPFNVERAPDGPGAPSALLSWSGGSGDATGAYTITLTGASYAPTPGSLCLAALGTLLVSRRRR